MSSIRKYQSDALLMILQSAVTIVKSDVKSTPDYDFYIIDGIDPTKVQLAVWIGNDVTMWALVGYDDRDMWFNLGDREDLKPSWLKTSSSWRSDLSNKIESPTSWLMQVIEDSK